MKKTPLIAVVCYNTIEFWKSRTRAIKFYKEGARCCEGCESERYANIVWDLMDGNTICHDGSSCSYEEAKERNRYHQFSNGTNIRDITGKVEYPLNPMGLIINVEEI